MAILPKKVFKPERKRIDDVSVTPNEAIFLLAHSLRMASIYYQNIPDNAEDDVMELLKEFVTPVMYDGAKLPTYIDPAIPAAIEFLKTISGTYAAMERSDDEQKALKKPVKPKKDRLYGANKSDPDC